MARLEFQFRPLEGFPKPATPDDQRKSRHTFKAQFPQTLRWLAYELNQVGAINPVFISTGHAEKEVRIDGLPRTDVRPPKFPGVVIEFQGKLGRLQFACDTYEAWEKNLHAIALTTERLRDVSRYGATSGEQQYAGFKALPPIGQSSAAPNFASVDEAAKWLAVQGDSGIAWPPLIRDRELWKSIYKALAKRFHPDSGKLKDLEWSKLQAAAELLNKHHGL